MDKEKEKEVVDPQLLEARAKLAERFGNTQIGGKGSYLFCSFCDRHLEKEEKAC